MPMDPLPAPLTTGLPTKDERTWAMAVHLSAFAGHLFPLAHIIVPLVIWLARKDVSAFVDDQGREAVNAQISVTIYAVVAIILCFVLVGIPLLIGLYVANVVFVIIATIKANDGIPYRYPLILRLVK